MSDAPSPEQPRLPQFPHHGQPRVWFLTAGCSAINVSLARQLLQHGDKVISCVQPIEFERDNVRTAEFKEFLEEAHNEDGWSSRLKVIGLDVRWVTHEWLREFSEWRSTRSTTVLYSGSSADRPCKDL